MKSDSLFRLVTLPVMDFVAWRSGEGGLEHGNVLIIRFFLSFEDVETGYFSYLLGS